MKRSSSHCSTIRLPSRWSPVTRFPSNAEGGGSTDRKMNGLRKIIRSSGWPRIRGVSCSRYRVMSGSSGMVGTPPLDGELAAALAFYQIESAGGSDLGLEAPVDHLSPALRIQTGAADQDTVELRPGQQRCHIRGAHAASIEDRYSMRDTLAPELHPDQL